MVLTNQVMQILEMRYSDLEQVAVLGGQLGYPFSVDESSRGHGIGKALLVAAESWALGNQLLLVRIRSNLIRSDAHQFYQKQGYSVKKSWHLFTKSLSNEGI